MEVLAGIIAGALLFGCNATSRSRFEFTWQGRLVGWLNQKRYERLRRKAQRLGFGAEFQEEWKLYEDRPFALQSADAYHAFYRAKARFNKRMVA